MPLPEGSWELYAAAKIDEDNLLGMAYFVVRIEQRHVDGVARIVAGDSTTQPPSGMRATPFCQASFVDNIYAVNEGCADFGSQSYWRIHNLFAGAWKNAADPKLNLPPLDRAAGQLIFNKGLSYPQDYLGVQFTRAEKSGFLQVDYWFAPPAAITSTLVETFRASDWHASNIKKFPEKMAFARKLQAWGTQFWPEFKASFAASQ